MKKTAARIFLSGLAGCFIATIALSHLLALVLGEETQTADPDGAGGFSLC